MNTMSVAQPNKQRNTFVPAQRPASEPTEAEIFSEYLTGQRKYLAHRGPDNCSNQHQLRGWNDANRYSAECEAQPYLREM